MQTLAQRSQAVGDSVGLYGVTQSMTVEWTSCAQLGVDWINQHP